MKKHFLCQIHSVFITVALQHNLKSLFLIMIVLPNLNHFYFNINFRIFQHIFIEFLGILHHTHQSYSLPSPSTSATCDFWTQHFGKQWFYFFIYLSLCSVCLFVLDGASLCSPERFQIHQVGQDGLELLLYLYSTCWSFRCVQLPSELSLHFKIPVNY